MPNQIKINAYSQAQLIKLLLIGDMTCAELSEETGLHVMTVWDYVRELHRAKAAHIARWDTDARGRYCVRVFKLGEGQDARRPSLTSVERNQRYRDRIKAQRELMVQAGKGRWVKSGNNHLRFEEIRG